MFHLLGLGVDIVSMISRGKSFDLSLPCSDYSIVFVCVTSRRSSCLVELPPAIFWRLEDVSLFCGEPRIFSPHPRRNTIFKEDRGYLDVEILIACTRKVTTLVSKGLVDSHARTHIHEWWPYSKYGYAPRFEWYLRLSMPCSVRETPVFVLTTLSPNKNQRIRLKGNGFHSDSCM